MKWFDYYSAKKGNYNEGRLKAVHNVDLSGCTNKKLLELYKENKSYVENVLSHFWYHKVQLGGFVTPGIFDMSKYFEVHMKHIGDINGKRILDVGAADGVFSVEFAKRGASVDAIETVPDLAEHIRFLANVNDVDVNVINCDFFEHEKNDYDVIFASNVLGHYENDGPFSAERFIEHVKKCMNENTLFVCSSPLTNSLRDKCLLSKHFKHEVCDAYTCHSNTAGTYCVTLYKCQLKDNTSTAG
jgi:2-polyprenyl-3-methyl-5-hydroxy-6-metoxy-1,4-benzoquinol methylase